MYALAKVLDNERIHTAVVGTTENNPPPSTYLDYQRPGRKRLFAASNYRKGVSLCMYRCLQSAGRTSQAPYVPPCFYLLMRHHDLELRVDLIAVLWSRYDTTFANVSDGR